MKGEEEPIGSKLQSDLLLFRGKIYVVENSQVITLIPKEFHDSKMGEHSGVEQTLKRIQGTFWWKKMGEQIRNYVANCLICQ